MEKAKKYKRALIVASAVLLVAMILVAIYLQTQPNPPKSLNSAEVSEYQGENLSSINSIVDNAIKGTQVIDEPTYRLTVNGLVNQTKEYNYSQVLNGFQKYEKVVTLHCVQGWQAKILWNGVLVRDLLNASGVNPAANTVIFHAKDGYTTSMPLSYFYDNDILLAYKMNGLVLPPEKGFPFQLVAESKWGYKWIKWITQIELSDNAAYQGYWENRGYPNDATIP